MLYAGIIYYNIEQITYWSLNQAIAILILQLCPLDKSVIIVSTVLVPLMDLECTATSKNLWGNRRFLSSYLLYLVAKNTNTEAVNFGGGG